MGSLEYEIAFPAPRLRLSWRRKSINQFVSDKVESERKLSALPLLYGKPQYYPEKGWATIDRSPSPECDILSATCVGRAGATSWWTKPSVLERSASEQTDWDLWLVVEKEEDGFSHFSGRSSYLADDVREDNVLIVRCRAQFFPLNVLPQPDIITQEWMWNTGRMAGNEKTGLLERAFGERYLKA